MTPYQNAFDRLERPPSRVRGEHMAAGQSIGHQRSRAELAADTEMLERVCETSSEHWTGSSLRTSAVTVAPDVLAKYVGVYSGFWGGRPRTVEVTVSGGDLVATIEGATTPLLARSETLFESSGGLGYRFIVDGSGAATHVEEIHVSGDYRYARRR
jgi:hypothetical protein